MREEEWSREQEMEKVCDAEVEKMWEKRVRQWMIQKQARQKLLEEVLASRRQQIQDKRKTFCVLLTLNVTFRPCSFGISCSLCYFVIILLTSVPVLFLFYSWYS